MAYIPVMLTQPASTLTASLFVSVIQDLMVMVHTNHRWLVMTTIESSNLAPDLYIISFFYFVIISVQFSLLDIDECTEDTHDCDVDASCYNTPGSFNCACNGGYSGNGTYCNGKKDNTDTDRHHSFCYLKLRYYFLLRFDANISFYRRK